MEKATGEGVDQAILDLQTYMSEQQEGTKRNTFKDNKILDTSIGQGRLPKISKSEKVKTKQQRNDWVLLFPEGTAGQPNEIKEANL